MKSYIRKIFLGLLFSFIAGCGSNSATEKNDSDSTSDSGTSQDSTIDTSDSDDEITNDTGTDSNFAVDSDSTTETETDSSVTGVCIEGSKKCNINMLQICENNKWVDFDDCVFQQKLCTVVKGISQCWSLGGDTDDSDSHTDSDTTDSDTADSDTTDSDTADSETTDSDTTDSDTTDSDTADSETADSETADSDIEPEVILSYIWIANSYDSTVSKVNTKTLVEEARYRTCPYASCDPSRTSVNRYGDMVVTNRFYSIPGGKSSVTKIASALKDCIDNNSDGKITTSTGPTDIKPWGTDECVLWNTELPFITDLSPRARATAWDGTEDPNTGAGGFVLIGSCIGGELNDYNEWEINTTNRVYFLNGNTGAVETSMTKDIPNSACLYGGAMDRLHNFWIMDGFGFPNNDEGGGLVKFDIGANTITRVKAECGYGITADNLGNVWLGGKKYNSPGVPDHVSCVQRYNSTTGVSDVTSDQEGVFLRGIAAGSGISDGYTWAAESLGHLYRIDASTMAVKIYDTPVTDNTTLGCDSDDNTCDNGLVGVAVDFDGYVWMVSTTEDAAYKFDPVNETFESVDIGHLPYTYSDMTGMQLRNVFIVH